MERLGPQDASFLYLEKPNVHQHVGGLAILDPSTRPDGVLRYRDLVEVIGSRLHLTPRFRQRVLFPPIPTARPQWVDDANFDLSFHLRRAALPAPGGQTELIEYVQRVISRPLDRTKPLWELYLIEGMGDGLSAILTKVHHAMLPSTWPPPCTIFRQRRRSARRRCGSRSPSRTGTRSSSTRCARGSSTL